MAGGFTSRAIGAVAQPPSPHNQRDSKALRFAPEAVRCAGDARSPEKALSEALKRARTTLDRGTEANVVQPGVYCIRAGEQAVFVVPEDLADFLIGIVIARKFPADFTAE